MTAHPNLTDDARKITAARLQAVPDFAPGIPSGQIAVIATLEDGAELELFRYFIDELQFPADEFTGLTVKPGVDLFARKDIAYLQAPD